MKKLLFIIYFISFFSYSQEIKIEGFVKDSNNRSIESASVIVMDANENNLGYEFSDENGFYSLSLNKEKFAEITVSVSSLGFFKKEVKVNLTEKSEFTVNFTLEESQEQLKEVIIEANQKIKINQDTTFIKVEKFANNTEQTVEDILKKLPGIQVQSDGSITAHGKTINKLLIEGEDIFDKNYKLLSKNLDAKYLEEVQILDNFEDNPVLKKLSNSDKVALNLKLKKGLKNVWFGNISVGLGTEKRFTESLNLGLLRKKIKLFYFTNYNNTGNKSSDQIAENQQTIDYSSGSEKIEKFPNPIFKIESNENTFFSNSQSLFNKAFSNSLSFTSKLSKKLTLRSVNYVIDDKQKQQSESVTQYNIDSNPILFTETNRFRNNNTSISGEVELKFAATEKSYFVNHVKYKKSIDKSYNNIINNGAIYQDTNDNADYFYNHLEHTYQVSNRKILTNYAYFGYNNLKQLAEINSESLNEFLGINSSEFVKQKIDNKLLYYGLRSSLISLKNKWENTTTFQFHQERDFLQGNLASDSNTDFPSYENNIVFKQTQFSLNRKVKYLFNRSATIIANANINENRFNQKDYFLFNSNAIFQYKSRGFGSFSVNYSYKNNLPQNNFLVPNSQLNSYRSFIKGSSDVNLINNNSYGINYSFFNDVKRYSLDASFLYIKTQKNYASQSEINQDFIFNNYFVFKGGDFKLGKLSLTNYIRKLKLATMIETQQSWTNNPIKINADNFTEMKNHVSLYKISGTTYFKKFCNFDFGYTYNTNQSEYNSVKSNSKTNELFVNVNHTFFKTWIAEIKSNYYYVNSDSYSFINALITFNPEKSKFSYNLLVNNLANEKQFVTQSIDGFTYNKTAINLVPRYFMITVKYRF